MQGVRGNTRQRQKRDGSQSTEGQPRRVAEEGASWLGLPSVLAKGLCHHMKCSHLGEEVCPGGDV